MPRPIIITVTQEQQDALKKLVHDALVSRKENTEEGIAWRKMLYGLERRLSNPYR